MLATAQGSLEVVVSGSGAPTLLLFNGAGMTLGGWGRLCPEIEQIGTVFAWNRLGAGRSDRPRAPQAGAAVVAALRQLLAQCALQPPYLLVAHSLGGLHAQLFSRAHPEEVAGVVLLEATHPRDRETLQGHETQLAAVLGKLFALPQRLFRANLHAEIAALDETARQLAAAGPFPPVPLTVLSGGQAPPRWLLSPAALEIRQAHQRELARLSPLGEQLIAARSGHFPQRSEPTCVLQVLRDMARKVSR